MKGIILAGGTGSRLYPLTRVTNKHLLPVGRYPMIYYPVYKLKEAGITDILVVTGREHIGDVVGLLGSGAEFGVTFTFRVQDSAGGIAHALNLGRDFAGQHRCVVLLGDNIFEASLNPFIETYMKQPRGAKLLLTHSDTPSKFGVADVSDGIIRRIEEKPEKPVSDLIVTGIYMYDSAVFDIISGLKPSSRGELEITDVNNEYIRRNELTFDILPGWWTDAGTQESLKAANEKACSVVLHSFDGKAGPGRD